MISFEIVASRCDALAPMVRQFLVDALMEQLGWSALDHDHEHILEFRNVPEDPPPDLLLQIRKQPEICWTKIRAVGGCVTVCFLVSIMAVTV